MDCYFFLGKWERFSGGGFGKRWNKTKSRFFTKNPQGKGNGNGRMGI